MKQKDYVFIGGATLFIFLVTFALLSVIGFVPEQFKFASIKAPKAQTEKTESANFQAPSNSNVVVKSNGTGVDSQDKNVIPTQILIPKIKVDSTINIPQSVDVAVLDTALTKGAVYYPGSGTLQGGNMFLFGHSSNWKIVNNEAYKTFNDLDKLVIGDEVTLKSGDRTYIYSVTSVSKASEDDALVNFASTGRMLTISTCDTFGRKQDRWVVNAEFKRIF